MKILTLSSFFTLFCFSLCAQIQIGNYDNNYYHVEYIPRYLIEDTVYSLDLINHSVPIDLDNDNIVDLSINSRYDQCIAGGPGGPTYYPYWESSISIINDSLDIISLPNNIADTLRLNDYISNNNNWVSYIQFRLAFNINNYTVDTTWKDKIGYFIGFRIKKPSQDTLFGWIQLDVYNYHIINLVEYACQSYYPNDTIINPYLANIHQVNINSDILTVSPNPFKNKLNIFLNEKDANIEAVELYSIHGELLIRKNSFSRNFELDTSELKHGVFILRVYLDNNLVINTKVVK